MPVGGGGGAGRAGDIRAGGAYYEVYANDKLSGTLDKMKTKALAFSRALKPLIASASVAVGGLLTGGVSRGAELARMSERFGLPIKLLSKLKHVADEAGVSIEEVMGDTSGRFSAAIGRAPEFDPEAARESLKIQQEWTRSLHELQEAMLPLLKLTTSTAERFTELSTAIKSISDNGLSVDKLRRLAERGAEHLTGGLLPASGGGAGFNPAALIDATLKAAGVAPKGGGSPLDTVLGVAGGAAVAARSAQLAKLTSQLMATNAVAAKGTFNTFGAMGRFGFGDQVSEVKKQTELFKQLLSGDCPLPEKIGDAVAAVLIPK